MSEHVTQRVTASIFSAGIAFLKRVGVREGDTVVDFGARVGHYTVPAAAIVGPKGKVYAFDKNAAALTELMQRTSTSIADRIVTVHTRGETELDRPRCIGRRMSFL